MSFKSIGFIGAGRITRILLKALKQKNKLPDKVLVSDPDSKMLSLINSIDPEIIHTVNKNTDALDVDILFLAVHPPVVKELIAEINGKVKADTFVVSLMPATAIEEFSKMLGGINKLVRMIPNAPSIIHKGYNPVVYSDDITPYEKENLQDLFSYWGEAPEVDEKHLEAYAIISAMGPTYFWFQWLKLQELGKHFGISDLELKIAIPAMLHGSIQTLFESDLQVKDVLDLIPVCPIKENEITIQKIFDEKLKSLYTKLTQKKN